MPSLNQAEYIEAAIRSVLEQDYGDVELVVRDALSSDGTQDILAKLGLEFGSRLRWISERDNGPAHAVNCAIAEAEGEIIGWLNSDDLYARGAISRALEFLDQRPSTVLVYGEARHINQCGTELGPYPTKPPSSSPAEFASGCFICQPSVFIRREVLDQVGSLDESFKTAFDFDYWLRAFKILAGRIGMISETQAFSRLHPGCITVKQKRLVALEGMRILSTHLGEVPDNWFWTYVDEICSRFPLGPEKTGDLMSAVTEFLKDARKFLRKGQVRALNHKLSQDERLRLGGNGVGLSIEPDGWVRDWLLVKYRWDDERARQLSLSCTAKWPLAGRMELTVHTPGAQPIVHSIDVPSDFILNFQVPGGRCGGYTQWMVEVKGGFVPARCERDSSDERLLAFKVESVELQ